MEAQLEVPRLCEEGGLHYTVARTFGEPGETRESVEYKLDFLRRINPALANLRVGVSIMPGTGRGVPGPGRGIDFRRERADRAHFLHCRGGAGLDCALACRSRRRATRAGISGRSNSTQRHRGTQRSQRILFVDSLKSLWPLRSEFNTSRRRQRQRFPWPGWPLLSALSSGSGGWSARCSHRPGAAVSCR